MADIIIYEPKPITIRQKMQVLEEYYNWLYENSYSADSACVLVSYWRYLKNE